MQQRDVAELFFGQVGKRKRSKPADEIEILQRGRRADRGPGAPRRG